MHSCKAWVPLHKGTKPTTEIFVISPYEKEDTVSKEIYKYLKKSGINLTTEQQKNKNEINHQTTSFITFRFKETEQHFYIFSYEAVEYLILDIIYFLFPHKEIKEIKTQLNIVQNNDDETIKPIPKQINKYNKTHYQKLRYSSFFIIFSILLGYTYFTFSKKNECLDIYQEVKLPDDSFLLKRERVFT